MHERRRRRLDDTAAEPAPARIQRQPGPSEVDRLLALQRSVGNAVVARAIAQQRRRAAAQGSPDTAVQRSAVHAVLRSPGTPLHEPVRAEMEARLDADFSDVRLHTGPDAARSAAEIGARAYTSGSHVVIGNGGADAHTLAHELTHVIQQRTGSVAGTDTEAGLRISDPGDRFEQAAEANARRVMAAVVPPTEGQRTDSESEPIPATAETAVSQRNRDLVQRAGDEIESASSSNPRDARPMPVAPGGDEYLDWFLGRPPVPGAWEVRSGSGGDAEADRAMARSAPATQKMVAGGPDTVLIHALRTNDSEAVNELRDHHPRHYELFGRLRTRTDWAKLSANQAWALVAAERKGGEQEAELSRIARERIQKKPWFAFYRSVPDLDGLIRQVAAHLSALPIATNYHLAGAPTRNPQTDALRAIAEPGESLADLLMGSGAFMNTWETGTSQATSQKSRRGAVEEHFGYALALGRTAGPFQAVPDDQLGAFRAEAASEGPPKNSRWRPFESRRSRDERRAASQHDYEEQRGNAAELPRYGALVDPAQRRGVSDRYGNGIVYWKDEVRHRSTHTPNDSWSLGKEGAFSVSSNRYPLALVAYGVDQLVRLAFARVTDFAHDQEMRAFADAGAEVSDYFETQIHGPLGWRDVERIVINAPDPDTARPNRQAEATAMAEALRGIEQRLNAYRSAQNLEFTVELRQLPAH
ncbi:eCIS core domain-containing protein [Actinoalloteichus hymeniacidonis]|uniref:eCIS core domain-containing protein n=1 Tax=Actinoalloteichus hymeniacidonis TaxID=340345 RepID=A0AAC9MYD3_9PSEU|nr:DUF4157 domain-containing protein [Actinoalloteichus hymeniacidonis]AOS64303.1 putative DUF4157 family protein/Protein of unknown function (DUF3626) [Actinoalloteichus hymeniacidonis]MBB5907629.1 hypothetical protein [Actinoalloteichus hymeniacidonis]